MSLLKIPVMLLEFILALLEAVTSSFSEGDSFYQRPKLDEDLYSQNQRLIEYERLAEKINHK
jgi:hypothetical protein